MKLKKNHFLFILFIFSASCSVTDYEHIRFSKNKDPSSQNPVLLNAQNATSIVLKDEKILTATQFIGDARLKDSFVKNIFNEKNELIFAEAYTLKTPPNHLQNKIKKLSRNRGLFLSQLKKENMFLALSPDIRMNLEISRKQKTTAWDVYWVVDFLDTEEDAYFSLEVSPEGQFLSDKKRLGSQFIHGEATVFPKGPKMSALSQVTLLNLTGSGFLTGPQLTVQSALPKKAFSENNIFNFDLKDTRFDDVQVYFFLQTIMTWFKDTLNFELPFPLHATVHVGGLESPKNTAYYYDGNIRLGSGDGVTYQSIPRDPSIVIHEAAHAYIQAIGSLASEGEGGSLNEAFADFITAVLLDHPQMAELSYIPKPYKRTLENEKTIQDFNGGLYNDSLVISGTLWDIRKEIGGQRAFELGIRVLSRLGPQSKLADFPETIKTAQEDFLNVEEQKKILGLLSKRGWP